MFYYISREATPRTTDDGIEIWPIGSFFKALWIGEF